MTKYVLFLLTLFSLLSCTKHINLFRTGTLTKKNYYDTVKYDKRDKYIVLPAKVNGIHRNLIFDTGADLTLLPKDSLRSIVKFNIKDANRNRMASKINRVKRLTISRSTYSNLYAIKHDLPTPFLCFADGLIGNNVIRGSNVLIQNNQIVFSNTLFDMEEKVSSDLFYYDKNRLFSSLLLNGCRVDTCLIDYGGQFDIELPLSFYERHKPNFNFNKITNKIVTSYGVTGKSIPDTVFSLNCNIDFNGLKIDSVNITIRKGGEKRVGLIFLKRFSTVAINNTGNKLMFGNLEDRKKPGNECIFSFDLVDSLFIVSNKILSGRNYSDLKIGDKLVEINSTQSKDFKSYCDFIIWNKSLNTHEYLVLKTIDNKVIKINNRR